MFTRKIALPIAGQLLTILNWLLDRCSWSVVLNHALLECHIRVGRFWMKHKYPTAYVRMIESEKQPAPPYQFGPFCSEPEPIEGPHAWWMTHDYPPIID